MTSKTTSTNETSGLIRRRSSFFSPSPTPEAPDHQKVLAFSQDNRHFSLLRNLHMADFITLLNGACGFNSVISSLKYAQTGDTTFAVRAMFLVPLGLFFDFMDGRVARWRNKSSLMGQELDSLADLVSFGVAPGLLAYVLGFQTVADQVALTVFVLCGLTRLARFNVTVANVPKDAHGKSKYFEGTPIPSTLLLVGLMYFWTKKDWILDDLPFGTVGEGIFEVHPLVALFVISGSAMISKSLHVPKP